VTTEEWLAQVSAARPPLAPAQKNALRPICQRMAQYMRTAPADTEAAHSKTDHPKGVIRATG
jgi:hypothetical protein